MNFWDIILSIFWFMLLFAWIWLLISIFADIFRDHELSGWGKALWALFIIVIPWLGGWLIGTFKLEFVSAAYLKATFDYLEVDDVVSGLVKASVFGFVIGLMGTWCGYTSRGGAQGVGGATTLAVVSSSILILALDYALTELFFAR